MLLEKLSDYLIEIGFSSIRLNIEHIYLFQQRLQKDGTIFTVLLFDFDQSNFTVQQFLSVRNQIEEKYRETEIFQTEFLCLLYGNESEQMKESVSEFHVGDTVKVYGKIVEGNRERIQVFEGIVLKKQGSSNRETFTVRKLSNGIGVEKTWPLHSPNVEKVEVVRRGKVRRAKLNDLRGRVGKRAKVKELVK